MATLSAVRDAIKTTLEANISGLDVHDTIPDDINPPCVVAAPIQAEFQTMGRGVDQWQFDLLVLVSRAVARTAQDSLDAYITGAGASSIRQVIFNNRSLGLTGTAAHITTVTNYSARYQVGATEYFGATLRLIVATPGTE